MAKKPKVLMKTTIHWLQEQGLGVIGATITYKRHLCTISVPDKNGWRIICIDVEETFVLAKDEMIGLVALPDKKRLLWLLRFLNAQ